MDAQSDSVLVRACLQSNGAVLPLQHASMGKSAEIQAAYEKVSQCNRSLNGFAMLIGLIVFPHVLFLQLIQQIYVTTPSTQGITPEPDTKAMALSTASSRMNGDGKRHHDRTADSKAIVVASASASLSTNRRIHERSILSATACSGWRFPPVVLSTVDEQYLFEFEVKLKLRTTTEDIVRTCQSFRNELLRNFPVEIFLQRPTILQYLLYLVQQPFLPGYNEATATTADTASVVNQAMESALELSLGVNYFDELDSTSFSLKYSNFTTAVFIAAMRAIESFVYALQRASRVCLNPVYLVHESTLGGDFLDTFDSRRTFYPRAMHDSAIAASHEDGTSEGGGDNGSTSQFSLSGAIYGLFTSLLALLVSSHHPRSHVLNVLHLALPLLPDRGITNTSTNAKALDKIRIEQILSLLGDFCIPVGQDLAQITESFSQSVTWRILELVIRLLQLHAPSSYLVESSGGKSESSSNQIIIVPDKVWRFVMMCASSFDIEELARREWKIDNIIGFLSEIDPSMASFLASKRLAERSRKHVERFIQLSKGIAVAGEKAADVTELAAHLSIDDAQKVAHVIDDLHDSELEHVMDGILLAFWTILASSRSSRLTAKDVDSVQTTMMKFFDASRTQCGDARRESCSYFFSQISRVLSGGHCLIGVLSSDARHRFVVDVLCEPSFLANLLLRGAAASERQKSTSEDNHNADAIWSVITLALRELASASDVEIATVDSVIPLLQHFAFMEPSENSPLELRPAQPQIVDLINRVEKSLPDANRLLLIARCLLHTSSYIRKAAASGVLRILSNASPTVFNSLADNMVRGYDDVLEDPFVAPVRGERDSIHPLEKRLMEVALTSLSDGQDGRTADISSNLAKLSALRKVLHATASSVLDIKETAIKELMLMVDSMSTSQFHLLEELGEVMEMKNLLIGSVRAATADQISDSSEAFVEALLVFLRNLLQRSLHLRIQLRGEFNDLLVLTPLIFDPRVAIRAQMYYIVLLLTLTSENFAPSLQLHRSPPSTLSQVDLIPEMMTSTFGLYSNRWGRCAIKAFRSELLLQEVNAAIAHDRQPHHVTAVGAKLDEAINEQEDETNMSNTTSPPLHDLEFVLHRLRAAKSHGRFLNALYHLIQLTAAIESVRLEVIARWEQVFERYIAVAPQTERDEIIIGSILSCLNSLVMDMERENQLRLLLVVKRSFIPLLKGTSSTGLSIQVMRILLHLSSSKVSDLFLTLAFDTNLLDVLCNKYATLYSTHPVLHALTLEMVLRFAACAGQDRAGGDEDAADLYNSVIYQRLLSLVSPLLSIVCRHRVPGSFLERDVFAMASQTLLGIITATPRDALVGGGTSVLSSDNNLLVDNSWSSRLLFDHSSQLRELGFRILAKSLQYAPPDAESRLVQLAIETSMDGTECDAVRGAACGVIYEALLHFDGSTESQLKSIFGAESLAANILRALANVGKDDKLLVNCGLNLCRLIRLLFTRKSDFAAHFGNVAEVLAAADQEYDVYPVLIQVPSMFLVSVLLPNAVYTVD